MKTILHSTLLLTTLLFSSAIPGAYLYKEATIDDTAAVSLFCEKQSIEPINLLTHLKKKENQWARVAIDVVTKEVKSLMLGHTKKDLSQASIDFLLTDPTIYKLTEAHLRHTLINLKKESINTCKLPAGSLIKSGIRSIKTDISQMLDALTIGSIRFDFYAANQLINPDQEILAALYKYEQLLHNKDMPLRSFAKKYQLSRSGLLVAYFGDVIVGITGIIDNATMHNNQACMSKIVVDDGFMDEVLIKSLHEHIMAKVKELGFDSIVTIATP